MAIDRNPSKGWMPILLAVIGTASVGCGLFRATPAQVQSAVNAKAEQQGTPAPPQPSATTPPPTPGVPPAPGVKTAGGSSKPEATDTDRTTCSDLCAARDAVWNASFVSTDAEKSAAQAYSQAFTDKKYANCADLFYLQPPSIEDAYSELNAVVIQLGVTFARLQHMSNEADITALLNTAKSSTETALEDFAKIQPYWHILPATCDDDGNAKDHVSAKGEKVVAEEQESLVCRAQWLWEKIDSQSRTLLNATKSLCGGIDSDGQLRHWCAAYGIVAASLSQIWKLSQVPYGLQGGRLVSVAVPYIGIRYLPSINVSFLALDLNLYSAYFTTAALTPNGTSGSSCFSGQNSLEKALPCESNPQIQPYAALQVGATFGRDGIGYVTLSPLNIGFANFGNEGVHPYFGLVAGSLQITGKF